MKCDLCGKPATQANAIFYLCNECSPTGEEMIFGPPPSVVDAHRHIKDDRSLWSKGPPR